MEFQRALLINLDSEVQRYELSAEELNKIGLPFERFGAVRYDGIPSHVKRRFLPLGETILSQNEIACFASHLLCLELISEEKHGFFAICEDDLLFHCDQMQMAAIIDCLSQKTNWELIRPNLFPKGPCVIRHEIAGHKVVDFFIPPVNAEFYFVQPSGARKIIDEAWDINIPFDVFLKDLSRWKIDAPGIVPPVTQQRPLTSTIDPDNVRNKNRRNKIYSYRKSRLSLTKEMHFIRKHGVMNTVKLFGYYSKMYFSGLKRDREMKYVFRLD